LKTLEKYFAPESHTKVTTRCGLSWSRQWRKAAASKVPEEDLQTIMSYGPTSLMPSME
jgi:hypothetical protein